MPLLTDGFLFLGSANFWRNGTNEEVGSVAISGCRKKWQLGKKASFMGEQNATVLTLSVLTGLSSMKISSKWLTVSCKEHNTTNKINIKETKQNRLK